MALVAGDCQQENHTTNIIGTSSLALEWQAAMRWTVESAPTTWPRYRATSPLLEALRYEVGVASALSVLNARRISVVDTEFQLKLLTEVAITSTMSASRSRGPIFQLPWTWLVDPAAPLNNWIKSHTKLSNELLAGAGLSSQHAARLSFLLGGGGANRGHKLVGWNVGSDKNIIEAALRDSGASYRELIWVDLAKMFHKLHPNVGVNPDRICKLSEACQFYGIPLSEREAHYAFYDVLATVAVLTMVCQEWEQHGLSREAIPTVGFIGPGTNPAVLDAPWHPIAWRLPDGGLTYEILAQQIAAREQRVTKYWGGGRPRGFGKLVTTETQHKSSNDKL